MTHPRRIALALAACASSLGGCGWIVTGTLLATAPSGHPPINTAPHPSSVVPASGSHGGGIPVTVSGTNFASDAVVTIGGVAAPRVMGSSSSLTVTLPRSSTLGPVDVVVTNPNGGIGTLARGFSYTNGLPVAQVSNLSSPQSQNVVFAVTISDPESDPANIEVEVLVGGTSLGPIPPTLILSGGLTGLDTSPTGVLHRITWDSRGTFGVTNATAVVLRVTPADTTDGKAGTVGLSNPFDVDNNTPVQVQIVQPANDAFDVAFGYRVIDPDVGENVTVTSLAWTDLASGGGGPLTVKSGQALGPVPYSAAGTSSTTVWSSLADLSWGNDRLVAVTVTVSDGSSTGTATTAPFFVSNGPLSDQRAVSLFQRPDGLAVGDLNGDGRPDTVSCRGGSSIDQQGRIAVAINRGQSFDATTITDAPPIPDPSPPFPFAGPNPMNPFLSKVPHPTECAVMDVNSDSRLDLVAAEAFNAPFTSVTPLIQNLPAVLAQCAADSGSQFAHVIAHQQTLHVLQNAGGLDFAAGTLYESAQAPRTQIAPLLRAGGQPPSAYPRPLASDPSLDQLGWFVQHLVAADLDGPGTPGAGQSDLVIVHGISRLGDAESAGITTGTVVIRQINPASGLLGQTFYLDPTDMGSLPTHAAVADILSATRTPGYMGLGATAPLGSPDIVVANTGDSSLTFYFQMVPSPSPGTSPPTYASFRLPVATIDSSISPGDTIGIAIGDLNGDGANDIVVVGQLSKTVYALIYDPNPASPRSLVIPSGGFLPFHVEGPLLLPSTSAGRPVIVDVSGDGRPDIVVPLQLTNEIVVFVNQTVGPGPTSFTAAVRFAAGFGPYEVVAADMNGDLRTDIVSANGLSQDFSVFYQTSPGTLDFNFIPIPSGISPLIARAGDVTGTGAPNVVVSMSGENSLYVYGRDLAATLSLVKKYDLGTVPGVAVTPSTPFDVKLADATGHGKLDILVAMEVVGGNGGVEIIPGCPLAATVAAVLTGSAGPIGFSAAAGNLRAGAPPDIVLTENQSDTIDTFLGQPPIGSLQFMRQAPPRNLPATQVVIADLDGDGHLDIVVGTGLPTLNVFYNGGDPPGSLGYGNFSPSPDATIGLGAVGNSVGVECADLTGTGRQDIVITGFTSATGGILFQTAPRTFAPPVPLIVGGQPSQIAIGDLNGDGLLDLAIPWGNDNVLAVYYQNPKKTGPTDTFLGPVTYPTANTPIGCCILDVLGNGKNGVVVSCRGADALNVFLQR